MVKRRRGANRSMLQPPATYYLGQTPGHQFAENLRQGVHALVHVVLGHQPAESKRRSLDFLDAALDWWADPQGQGLDRPTRWMLEIDLAVCQEVIDIWTINHVDSPANLFGVVLVAALGQVKRDLYTEYDDDLRLNALGLLSDDDLRREIARTDEEFLLPQLHLVGQDMQALRAAIAAFPLPS